MIRNPACLFVCDWDNFKEFSVFFNHQSSKIGYKNISPNTRGVTLFRLIFYIFKSGVAAGFLLITIQC
jgi:hypothetical protein